MKIVCHGAPMTQPNILFVQADQLSGLALGAAGHPVVQTPHIDRLAAEGVMFDSAHCPFPLCGPSRFSMLSGQLASRIGAYDNGAELPASVPTFAHYLRARGYATCLIGKMHFVGPDQLHGFEERLTSDIYPSDFYWTDHTRTQTDETASDARGVMDSGVCERSVQLDHDELVMFRAEQKLFDLARSGDERPFLLAVSLIHPHDPFYCTPEYWDRYDGVDIPLPRVGRLPVADQDPLTAYICRRHQLNQDFDPDALRRARRGYYGAVSYIDDQVGRLRALLERLGLAENTVIVFTSDHGESLGERGLWYKRNHFEASIRVPLIVHAPGRFAPARRAEHVSLVDLLPTLLALAGDADGRDLAEPVDGRSLLGLIDGSEAAWDNVAYAEVMSDGLEAPVFMVRRDRFKLIAGPAHPPMLVDPVADPDETDDLAADPAHAGTVSALLDELNETWNAEAVSADLDRSVARRMLIRRAFENGPPPVWDFEATTGEEGRWCRGGGNYNDWAYSVLKPKDWPKG
jgi:choline-sulfatase